MAVVIRIKRGTTTQWNNSTTPLSPGELGYDLTSKVIKIGDGTTLWNNLNPLNKFEIDEISQDAIYSALTNFVSTGENVTVEYNDAENFIRLDTGPNVVLVDALNNAITGANEYTNLAISGLGDTIATDYVPQSDVGNPGGVASLDSLGYIPDEQIPSTITRDSEIFRSAVKWTSNHYQLEGGENTRYLAGDVVWNDGNIYIANYDNESLPVSNTQYWSLLGAGKRLNIDGRDIPNITWTNILDKPILFDGNYNSLSNLPTLFSGSYNDLIDKPNLFDGNYNSLSNLPNLFSGSYNDLTNKPTFLGTSNEINVSTIDGITTVSLPNNIIIPGDLSLSNSPTQANHAATKAYVDNITAGLNFHAAVHAATSSNLAATYNNTNKTLSASGTFPLIDGETILETERVLVKSQTDAKQNGIYTLTDNGSISGTWILTRTLDADNSPTGEISYGDFVFVQTGLTNGGYGFIMTSTGTITLGSSNINWTQFNAGQSVVAGNGLLESTPGTLSINTAVTVDINTSQTLSNKIISGLSNTFSNIGNSSLTNSSITVGSTNINLGDTTTTLTGLSSVTSTSFVGSLTGNASTVTNGVYTSGSYSDPSWLTISKSKVGLSNVDNTSDANKPISTDTQTALDTKLDKITVINAQPSSYTVATSDSGKLIEMSGGGTLTIVDSSSFPTGFTVDVLQTGSSQVTVAGSGFTPNATPGLKLRAQWSSATLIKRSLNSWVVLGDLSV